MWLIVSDSRADSQWQVSVRVLSNLLYNKSRGRKFDTDLARVSHDFELISVVFLSS